LLDREEFVGYFTGGVKGDVSAIETLGNVLSMCAVSSPQYLDFECGGMNYCVFGKKKTGLPIKECSL
jgi:hypothetical protein